MESMGNQDNNDDATEDQLPAFHFSHLLNAEILKF